MDTKDLLILGAVAIGGYFLYTKIVKPVTDTVSGVTGATGDTWSALTTPGINFIPGLQNVDVGNLITTPGYQLISDALSKVSLPSIPAVLTTPGYKILGDLLNPKPKATTPLGTNTPKQIVANANTSAIRQATPIYDTPGKQVALATNKVIPFTSPYQQIATYQVAPKIVKVNGISKKVM